MLSSSQLNTTDIWVSAGIASLIVLIGWVIAAYFIIRYVNRRVDEITDSQTHNELGKLRYLVYSVSVLCWPAALIFGIYFLNKTETVRTGRICIFILVGTFTVCVLIAIAIVIAVIAYFPELAELFNKIFRSILDSFIR